MALSAYTGPPGSGKSYGAVSDVMLPAYKDGRTIRTNVSGVEPAKWAEYAAEKWPDRIPGKIIKFDGRETLDEAFFPDPDHPDRPATVKPGDLVVLDEMALYWPVNGKFPAHIERYLRFHRHMTDRDGQSSDVVIVTQSISDIHRSIRSLLERSFKFKKLSTVGLNDRFAWTMWEGHLQRKGADVANGGGKYRPELFPLYKSANTEQLVESQTSQRGNVLKDPKLWATAAGLVVVAGIAVWFLVGMFGGGDDKPAQPAAGQPVAAAVAGSSAPAVASQDLRIAGVVRTAHLQNVVLADVSGRLRLAPLSSCYVEDGRPMSCQIDGKRVVTGALGGARPAPTPIFGGVVR